MPTTLSPEGDAVVVVCDQTLIAEAVATALTEHGLTVTARSLAAAAGHPLGPEDGRRAAPPRVGLLICDLEPPARLATVERVLAHAEVDWVLMTGTPRGPLWGAPLAAGARLVLPNSTALREAVAVLKLGLGGSWPRQPGADELVRAWREIRAERAAYLDRMRSLSPRELSVLEALYSGTLVHGIATRYGISESTVRSHVRAILRKLGVTSQLAAVAVYAAVREELPGTAEADLGVAPRAGEGG